MQELTERTWGLSSLMCQAAEVQLFSTVLVVNEYRHILGMKAGWAGGEPNRESCAPYIGPLKAMELLIDFSGTMVMTPTAYPLGCGWMGGVRRLTRKGIYHITSCSGWSERCDAQHALVLNYASEYEVRFHHIGFRHPTYEDMREAVEEDEERLGVSAIPVPALDHERYYVPVVCEGHPNGVYWREHQHFPGEEKPFAIHWDLATSDALGLLNFVAGHLEAKPITWEAGETDPVGVTWELNRDSVSYGIMTRPRWWNVR